MAGETGGLEERGFIFGAPTLQEDKGQIKTKGLGLQGMRVCTCLWRPGHRVA